jgi:phage tail sheath gpL-like
MTFAFKQIPAGWKLPLVSIETDASQAGTVSFLRPALLAGQKLAAGAAAADTPIAITSLSDAKVAFGEGSQLERMFATFFKGNAAAVLFGLPVVEPSGGTAATGSITITNAPTAAGVLTDYIAGQKVQTTVTASNTAAQVATALAAAINAMTTLPVTAVAATAAVNLTARWKGLTGNDITIVPNYAGASAGEVLPTGLTQTIVAMSGGAGAPDVTAAIASIGDDPYDYVTMPWTDNTTINAFEAEFGFSDNGRNGWMRQSYGGVFTARRDTYGNQVTWGLTGNCPVDSVMDIEPDAPSPVWEFAAAYCARAAGAYLVDPARSLQTLELVGVLPAPRGKRRSKLQLNTLAGSGLATQAVNGAGNAAILAETSRYQKNGLNQLDTAYEHITTLYTLTEIFRRLTLAVNTKYPRHKLANNGTRFGPNQAIITPNVIKAELISEAAQMEYDGLIENLQAFKNNLDVQRDAVNVSRVNVLYPPDLVNNMRVFAVLAQFRLQYSDDQLAA